MSIASVGTERGHMSTVLKRSSVQGWHGDQHWNLVGGAERARLGLVAARSAAAARRALMGRSLDSFDEAALVELGKLLRAGAEVIEFFDSEGKRGMPPSGPFANGVGLAIETLHPSDPAGGPTQQLEQYMISLGQQVDDFSRHPDESLAPQLIETLTALSSAVMRELGSVGETTSRI